MNRILFIELLGGLGDLIIALPAIHALALSHPQAHLEVLTFAPGAELLEADPLVRRVYRAERGDAAHPERPRAALEALLLQERFDLIVSDTRYAGIAALLESTGTRVVSDLWRQPPGDQLIEERFLQILREEGLIEPWTLSLTARLSLDAGDRVWAASQFPRPARRALLHPHAGMPIKAWPAQRFVALGRVLRDSYGLEIVIPEGVGREVEVSHLIARALDDGVTLLPTGTLRQFAAAVAHTDLAIGPDTGPVRIASAVGVLTVTLFGPSWSGRYGQRPFHVNLQGFSACPLRVVADFTQQPCWYAGVCPIASWRSCLEDISVGDVLEACDGLLKRPTWWGKSLPAQTIHNLLG